MQFVNIKDGKLPVRFGMAAMRDFENATGKGIKDLQNLGGENGSLSDIIALLWCGVKQGHRVAKLDFNMSQDDICDVMDENPNFIEDAMQVLNSSMASNPNKIAAKKTGRQK